MQLKYTKTIATIAGAIVSVAAAFAVFGVEDVPRPAWSGELRELAGEVIELNSRVTAQQLDDAKLRWFRNHSLQLEHPGDATLQQEQVDLERRIDDLEDRLGELRDED